MQPEAGLQGNNDLLDHVTQTLTQRQQHYTTRQDMQSRVPKHLIARQQQIQSDLRPTGTVVHSALCKQSGRFTLQLIMRQCASLQPVASAPRTPLYRCWCCRYCCSLYEIQYRSVQSSRLIHPAVCRIWAHNQINFVQTAAAHSLPVVVQASS